MAAVLGKTPRCSRELCRGIAEGLAVMATSSEPSDIAGTHAPRDLAARIIAKLLERANSDWRVWASLSERRVLGLLAEAAPDTFLRAADRGLQGDEPPLLNLFAEDDAGFSVSSPHVGLLWALETLAWSSEHLSYASIILARLARLDPGGNLANRPAASLHRILIPVRPQTEASLEQRLHVIEMLQETEPDVAWSLMVGLMPRGGWVLDFTAKPKWREWGLDRPDDPVSTTEYLAVIETLTRSLLRQAGHDGHRWSDLLGASDRLPPDLHGLVLDKLEELGATELPRERHLVPPRYPFANPDGESGPTGSTLLTPSNVASYASGAPGRDAKRLVGPSGPPG